MSLTERAEHENRLSSPVIYYRAAEFFVSPSEPEKEKEKLHVKFLYLMY
ncbi:MAG: hypothetical protein ACTSUN_05105 [Promethearchaeota archaeon]